MAHQVPSPPDYRIKIVVCDELPAFERSPHDLDGFLIPVSNIMNTDNPLSFSGFVAECESELKMDDGSLRNGKIFVFRNDKKMAVNGDTDLENACEDYYQCMF